jgi:hypothetical protein
MSHNLSQRCTAAMAIALSLGLAAALLAWGPLHWGMAAGSAGIVSSLSLEWASQRWWLTPQLWVAAVLMVLALWVQVLFARCQRRAGDVTWPWRLLVLMAALRAGWWVVQSSVAGNDALTTVQFTAQLSQAALAAALCWGLMAERFKARPGVWVALGVGVGLLGLVAFWCCLVPHATALPGGDARAVLFLQLMPVVLAAAGILGLLPGRGLSRGESLTMIAAYMTTWFTTWWPSISHFFGGAEAAWLMMVLPWVSFCALCLLALIPVCNVLRAQQGGLLGMVRADRRALAPAWLPHFSFDTFATPNRRNNA